MTWRNGEFSPNAKEHLMIALRSTGERLVEPNHLLLAILDDRQSPLVETCLLIKPTLDRAALREAVNTASRRLDPRTPPDRWSDDLVSPAVGRLLGDLQADHRWQEADASTQDRLLAVAVLQSVSPRIRKMFTFSGIDCDALERQLGEGAVEPLVVFDASGRLVRDSFDRPATSILQLITTEGRGLGLVRIGSPLLLFAFVSRTGGLLERGLRLQKYDPKQLHENLLLTLRALGKRKFNEDLELARAAMQPVVADTFCRAADLAGQRRLSLIGEAELLKALILEGDHFVSTFLESVGVDLAALAAFVSERYSGEEEPQVREEKEALLPTIAEIETRLRERIVGQDHVIRTVMPLLKRLRFGFLRRERPVGVLLLLGLSGTGKTQLAKEIAKAVYGSEEQLIFLEMGQFGSEHSKTMFVGAPPGLVGYGEGLLTNGLRDKPESVVLFDEVEKAHKSVFDVVLRFLDEGRIADPAGSVRDGRRCLLILTSNHALDVLAPLMQEQAGLTDKSQADEEEIQRRVRQAVLDTELFRPEFLNRVDHVILFNSLQRGDFERILRMELEQEQQRLDSEKHRTFTYDDTLVESLVDKCWRRRHEGARVCRKIVTACIVDALIDFFVADQNRNITVARVEPCDQGIKVSAHTG